MEPGWVEARWVADEERRRADLSPAVDEAVDWLVVEDHTGADVAVYQHVTLWQGRLQATLTLRHLLGADLGDVVGRGMTALAGRVAAAEPAG